MAIGEFRGLTQSTRTDPSRLSSTPFRLIRLQRYQHAKSLGLGSLNTWSKLLFAKRTLPSSRHIHSAANQQIRLIGY